MISEMTKNRTKLTGELPGQKVGRLTITDKYIKNDKGEKKYLCHCDCGNEKYILERTLRYGGAESCGCLRKENALKAVSHDLEGKVFGELTVLYKAENQRKNGGVWWTCRCSCGNLYDVPGTLLVTGKRTDCGRENHKKAYHSADIAGQNFNMLTALYPTEERDYKGSVIWHCRCACGNEVDISYNALMYSNIQSCGCRKKEHDEKLNTYLTHVAGTSLDMVKSKKLPADNTTGCKGVYFIRGKYVAKIVFQKKQYYLGAYSNIEEAVEARKEAEAVLFDGFAAYYEKYRERAEANPAWAEEHPVEIRVSKDSARGLEVLFYPVL